MYFFLIIAACISDEAGHTVTLNFEMLEMRLTQSINMKPR